MSIWWESFVFNERIHFEKATTLGLIQTFILLNRSEEMLTRNNTSAWFIWFFSLFIVSTAIWNRFMWLKNSTQICVSQLEVKNSLLKQNYRDRAKRFLSEFVKFHLHIIVFVEVFRFFPRELSKRFLSAREAAMSNSLQLNVYISPHAKTLRCHNMDKNMK